MKTITLVESAEFSYCLFWGTPNRQTANEAQCAPNSTWTYEGVRIPSPWFSGVKEK